LCCVAQWGQGKYSTVCCMLLFGAISMKHSTNVHLHWQMFIMKLLTAATHGRQLADRLYMPLPHNATQIDMRIFVFCCPRGQRQVHQCLLCIASFLLFHWKLRQYKYHFKKVHIIVIYKQIFFEIFMDA
jgi:hypothetical protein